MGIERFFSTLKKSKDNFFTDMTSPYHNNITIKKLFIDMNSIIHNLSSILLSKNIHSNTILFEKELLKMITDYIIELTNMFKNINFIYIAIDGVPSLPKINEQKNRRYISMIVSMLINKIDPETKPFEWSKDNISTYSDFMNKLSDTLNSKQFTSNFNKVIVSSHTVPGEGEMKIIKYIIDNNIMEGLVFSPDSDMLLLLGLLDRGKNNNYILLRNDNNKTVVENKRILYTYNYTNIKPFHDYLLKYLDTSNSNIIKDIIFIFSLFGNDFIPKLECLRIESDIKLFLEIYKFNLNLNGTILNFGKKASLNYNNFISFLEILQTQENMFLQRNQFVYKYFQYDRNMKNQMINDIDNIAEMLIKHKVTIDNYKKSVPYLRISLSSDTTHPFGFLKYKIIQTLDYHMITDNIIFITEKELLDILFEYIINNIKNYREIFMNYKKGRWFYRKLNSNDFNTKYNKYHRNNLDKLNFRKQLIYKIQYKLDNFYEIFDRTDNFYENTINIKSYYNMKKINPNDIIDYLRGIVWIVDYYINIDDSTEFVYNMTKSPLLTEMIDTFSKQKITNTNANSITIKMHKKLISPDIKLLKKYLKTNFKGILDCTSSIFTNKCHVIL
tara:strand:+ start:382 stop:2220 length:1839 start_codon:yes stop_codon:yes gene_type:complete